MQDIEELNRIEFQKLLSNGIEIKTDAKKEESIRLLAENIVFYDEEFFFTRFK